MSIVRQLTGLWAFTVILLPTVRADETPPNGVRVFHTGHSFHVFLPPIISDMAKGAGIKGHEVLGLSAIGGSRVIQHWDVADEKNKARQALKDGKVDVLTLAPIHLPDPGIENFARLAVEHNPNIRITVQESWMPFDMYDPTFKLRPEKVDHNAAKVDELRAMHEKYCKLHDDHIAELNKKLGKRVLFAVPVGPAVVTLREKILAGHAPGLKVQADLFTDAIGHARAPLMALNAYCHFAVIYQRSPVGLPVPNVLKNTKLPDVEKLNRLLQEIAWDAVRNCPQSGVSAK